jgi:hypothetical protein
MPFVAVVTIVLGIVAALAIATCVAVIALQLHRTSSALADVDSALAGLPGGLVALEPAMDTINGSLARIAEVTRRPAAARV